MKLVVFTCNWDAYSGLENAGRRRLSLPPSVRTVKVACLGRLNPGTILKAFEFGADGVLLLGCAPDRCHYEFGRRRTQEVYQTANELILRLGFRLGFIPGGYGPRLYSARAAGLAAFGSISTVTVTRVPACGMRAVTSTTPSTETWRPAERATDVGTGVVIEGVTATSASEGAGASAAGERLKSSMLPKLRWKRGVSPPRRAPQRPFRPR